MYPFICLFICNLYHILDNILNWSTYVFPWVLWAVLASDGIQGGRSWGPCEVGAVCGDWALTRWSLLTLTSVKTEVIFRVLSWCHRELLGVGKKNPPHLVSEVSSVVVVWDYGRNPGVCLVKEDRPTTYVSTVQIDCNYQFVSQKKIFSWAATLFTNGTELDWANTYISIWSFLWRKGTSDN